MISSYIITQMQYGNPSFETPPLTTSVKKKAVALNTAKRAGHHYQNNNNGNGKGPGRFASYEQDDDSSVERDYGYGDPTAHLMTKRQ